MVVIYQPRKPTQYGIELKTCCCSESGVMINTFSVWTDAFAFELDAADLVDGATAFGSLELTFENAGIGLLGGTALFQASAEGRYAVTWRGNCLP